MRILVLAASGGCGRWVTQLAARQGHQVTALVRPTTVFQPPPGVIVERGSALDVSDLARVARGQDAVISCIGPERTDPRNLWAPLQPPPSCAERSATAVVMALEAVGVHQFAAISAAGVGDSAKAVNPFMRWLIRKSTIGEMYADLAAMEQVLRRSHLDWLAVRPVSLVNAAPSTRTKVLSRFRSSVDRRPRGCCRVAPPSDGRGTVSEGPHTDDRLVVGGHQLVVPTRDVQFLNANSDRTIVGHSREQ